MYFFVYVKIISSATFGCPHRCAPSSFDRNSIMSNQKPTATSRLKQDYMRLKRDPGELHFSTIERCALINCYVVYYDHHTTTTTSTLYHGGTAPLEHPGVALRDQRSGRFSVPHGILPRNVTVYQGVSFQAAVDLHGNAERAIQN